MAADRERDISAADEERILAELTARFDYATLEWEEVRREGRIDVRCVSGDPWDPKERQARKQAQRPCLSLDELGQYVNQLINEVRQHKRSIKVTPVGNKSKEPIARLRGNLIRQIEYRSNAQIAYTTMFENAVQRSYGFLRIKPRYEHVRSFHQELIIEPFQNPDMVTVDPDDLSPTGADMKFAFVHEWWNIQDFRRRWPNAKVKGADPQWAKEKPKWWRKDRIQVAEYWTIDFKSRELLQLQMPATEEQPQGSFVEVFADEMVMPADDAHPEVKRRWLRKFGQTFAAYNSKQAQVINRRDVDYPYVCQYMTNGSELLPPDPEKPGQLKHKWMGTSIPIIACYGKILWVDESGGIKSAGDVIDEDGSGATRKILSLVRLARDPQMLYCYYRTCEAELVGMTPKTPFIGYVGQFRTRQDDWGKINQQPQAYIEADPMVDGASGQVLPLPQRQPYDPPIQPLEIGAESARRAIQAAMGIMPLPTSAQRQNEKSGVALERIQSTSQQGSFHFVDHYEMSITECGKKLDELLDDYYDAARDVTVRDAAGETKSVRINDPQSVDEEAGEPLILTDDPYDVTLSTGPNFDSEREQATEFADTLVANIQGIAGIIGPQASSQLLSLAVKLRNLGPIGDQIADMLSPAKDKLTPEQMQQQLAQAKQMIEDLQAELMQAQQVIATKQVETQGKAEIERMKAQADAQTEAMKAQADGRLEMQRLLAETQSQMRELEVKLEIELAKIGSAQALARGEQEMQQLHHHDEMALRQQENATAEAQATLDRQAAQEQAEKDRQASQAVAEEPSEGV